MVSSRFYHIVFTYKTHPIIKGFSMKKLLAVSLVLFFASASQPQVSPAVAANMRFAFEEIGSAFTKKTGCKVTPVYGSSGKLVTQIKTGAPYDLFISADVAFTDSVVASKLAEGTPKIYAYGKLVLWTTKNFELSKGISVLADTAIKIVALGDLKLTVYGPAAKKLLENSNLWTKVEPKAVYGENITKTAQFIAGGSADIGFTAKSIVLSDEMKGKGRWIEIDSGKYDPMPQAAVILKHGESGNTKATHALFDFLYSKEAQDIMLRYGYKIP
jgi:molybdate transport system substrate-binding protein